MDLDRRLRQMDRMMNRFMDLQRKDLNNDPYCRKHVPDPKTQQLEQLVTEFSNEVEEIDQNEKLAKSSIATTIQDQMDKSSRSTEDLLLQSVLTTICLNPSVRTDLVQFLRLMMKQKNQESKTEVTYAQRNKIINSLTIVLKIASYKDAQAFLEFFGIEISGVQAQNFKIADA